MLPAETTLIMRNLCLAVGLFLTLWLCACRKPGAPAVAVRKPVPVSEAYRFPLENPERGEDQPGAAARYELERRSVDSQPVPVERYERALRTRASMRAASLARGGAPVAATKRQSNAISLGNWEQLGPGNVAGMSRSLVIDPRQPNTMYTTGMSGGIWKTTDGGQNWRAVGDLLPILVIGSLAMDPNDSRVLYAGTGDGFVGINAVRGGGIYKSADAGETWSRLGSTATDEFVFVNKIVVSGNIARSVYAATNAGVMRSQDGGVTWSRSLNRGLPNRGCHDLALRTDFAADYMFASCGIPGQRPGADLRLGTDPRENISESVVVYQNKAAAAEGQWSEVLTDRRMGRTVLAIAPSNQSTIYAVASVWDPNFGPYANALLAVYRSTTGGDAGTWQERVRNDDRNRVNTLILSNPYFGICAGNRDTIGQAWHNNAAAVDPRDPNRLWVGGVDLFRSDDGGQNFGIASLWWISGFRGPYVHADQHAIVFHPGYDGESNRTMYSVTDGGVFRTSNARAGVATGPGGPCDLERIGTSWDAMTLGLTTMQFYAGSVYPGGSAYLGGAQDNGSARGSDQAGFRSWQVLTPGDGGRSVIDVLDPNIIFQAAQNFELDKSIDGGGSFQLANRGMTESGQNFAFVAPFAGDPRDTRRLWAAGTRIWSTTTGADLWFPASVPLAGRNFTALSIAPSDSNFVVAGARTGEVFRNRAALSATGTTDWEKSQPRVGWVSSLAFDPGDSNVLYASFGSFNRVEGDAHIYRSTDGGVSWSASDGTADSALPDAPFHTVAVNPDDPRMLVAGGDLGLFVSTDAGATWSREEDNLPAVVVNHVAFHRESGGLSLYAFTFGRGLWRIRLSAPAVPCQFAVSGNATISVPSAGGTEVRTIDTAAGCAWSAVSNVNWVKVTSIATGTGPGTLRLLVDPNVVNPPRTGVVTIADKSITVRQEEMIVLGQWDEWEDAPLDYVVPFSSGIENVSATVAPSDPIHSCIGASGSKTIWWRFTAHFTGTVSAQGAGFRLDVAGNPPFSLAAFEISGSKLGPELACGANLTPAPGFVTLGFPVVQGQQYALGFANHGPNNPGGFLMVSVTRGDAALDFAPKVVDFGDVRLGESAERRLLIRNAGNLPVTIPAIRFADPQFTVFPAASFEIPVRAAREISVRFQARSAGSQSATIALAAGVTVPVRAQVVEPQPAARPSIFVEPLVMDFGGIAVGEKAEIELVVRNSGQADLTVSALTVQQANGAFRVEGAEETFSVEAGGSRRMKVVFAPGEAGLQRGQLIIGSNDPERPAVTVVLQGEGQ